MGRTLRDFLPHPVRSGPSSSAQRREEPEGRFHHDGLPALYLSSRADWAAKVIDTYRHPGDPAPWRGRSVAASTPEGAICGQLETGRYRQVLRRGRHDLHGAVGARSLALGAVSLERVGSDATSQCRRVL